MKRSCENRKNKLLIVGRRFGKTGMLYHTIVDSLPVSDEKKKELYEQYEKALRGEMAEETPNLNKRNYQGEFIGEVEK